ncbi:peptide ABC transporter ATP-binding protein [Lonsdalea iberica]|uniref:ABC-type dipeptide transporter n=1 Tax=Lonsdalea iberica TaxID=1082703 RepID=A0A1X3S082_9GAMM|nr:ABC transporter ATP-binding protein [Lonsdalea iberica]OSN07887.1 peptide ABC transporter ATP-binding protein [Lonsdalea iberica]OSN11667.1 peptide ABC transporter ATP-binding protein [Lonsdalea iberica]
MKNSETTLLDVNQLSIGLADDPDTLLVHPLSFRLGRERVALVGESGSGKSLTAKSLMGLLPSACRIRSGDVVMNGQSLASLSESQWRQWRGDRVSMVLQDPKHALNPMRQVGWQVEEPLKLHTSLPARERREKVLDMLDAVGLAEPKRLYKQYPHQLSGGMGQRVMLAIALITEPELLIADEPTSALDHERRDQVLSLIDRLVEERNMGLLLISHDLPQVARHCERVLVMYKGRLMDALAAEDLPQATHPYTRTLWNCQPGKHTRGQVLPVLDRALLESLS